MFDRDSIKEMLETKYYQYNNRSFIDHDPIKIPHKFNKKQDIEISALLTSIISWGKREIILKNAEDWMRRMDYSPHNFICNFKKNDLKSFNDFKHRTFQPEDCKNTLLALQHIYKKHHSLEELFISREENKIPGIGIHQFREAILTRQKLSRTSKHFPDPFRKSACKRMCMFLRWMVRKDASGVDFGIWKKIQKANLYLPLDVHTARSARALGLLTRKQDDWPAVLEVTNALKRIDEKDPVKYDFALFGLSINKEIT
jgi:uncharacterized protein (TIGR02757 family)